MTFIKLKVTKIKFFVAVLFALTFLSVSGSIASEEDYYMASQSEMLSSAFSSEDWDIDGDGRADALTDGLLFLRYAFGLTGDALIGGVVASDAQYTTASDIEQELATVYTSSGDIDGNGEVDALTDGLLLLRYLFGLDGDTLTAGVIGNGATLTDSAALETYLSTLMPQAPYITLNGSATINHEQATSYVDAGATAKDFIDGSVTVTVAGSIDSDTAGVYTLSYSATDSEGNVSRILNRIVTVADTTAPVITLAGDAALDIEQGATYSDAGATATDTVDGSVTVVTTGSVDTATAGTYTLTYTATDNAGNVATKTRAVTVKQLKAALSVETLSGNWSLSREAGALSVGETADNLTWWSNNEIDVWTRACLFDDVYTFGADGSFSQELGSETWLEPWQGTDPEACGAPVAPHDGDFTNGSYTVSGTSITINGTGAHLGLAKVINLGDLSVDDAPAVPESITYTVAKLADDGMSMTIQINYGAGFWQFKFTKSTGAEPVASDYGTGLDKVLNIGEVVDFNTVDADYGLIDFGGTVSSIIADPTDTNNTVVSVTKGSETEVSETWAGTTIATGKVFYPLTASKTGITVRVWSPEIGTKVKLKLEQSGDNSVSVETDATTTVAAAWETLTFDFANHTAETPALDASAIFDTLIIYFNFDTAGSGETYYFDDIRFIGAVPVSVNASELVGNWKLAPTAAAMSVGVSADNLTSYSNSIGDVGTRSCLFDDLFIFGADGSFIQEMGSQTWVESWQGATAEGCALPVAPHNGSATDATYTLADTKVTLTGLGAYLGLPKVTNEGELNAAENPPAVPSSITYTITSFSTNGQNMTVQIDYGTGVWQFKFVKTDDAAPTATINVTVAANNNGTGNVYVIDGVQKKELTLVVGTTYTFTHPSGHPFRFSTTSDGTFGGGTAYTAGVDTSVAGKTTIRVTSSTPTNLFYYCSVHAAMGGKIIFAGAAVSDVIRIEAENWISAGDVETESTTDTGGGLNVGYIDNGDFMEYDLSIPSAGNYAIDYRVASQGGSEPGLNIKIDTVWVDTAVVPNTGGWQKWQTVTGRVVSISEGEHTLRLDALSGSININWIEFTPTDAAADEPPTEVVKVDPVLSGDWTLLPEAGALGVGPSSGNIGWWSNNVEDVTTRACLFDDIFRFGSDGSFANVMGDETWLEAWQGGSEACAAPVAPHDGSNSATFVFDSSASTITVNGLGAHLGLPKVVNAGELDKEGISVPESITYEIVTSTATSMTIEIGYGSGYWTFKFAKIASAARAESKNMSHDGDNRSYVVYVPNTYGGSEKFPVMLNFHGFGGQAQDYLNETDMRYSSHINKFILVYPQGTLSEGSSHWNPSLPSLDNKSDADDLGFVEALVNQLSLDYAIDLDRIYAVGYSNGGMMSYGLASHKSELLAAFGSVSGTMLATDVEPSHPMPVFVMHGTSDGTLPYNGSEYYSSVDSALDYWTNFNNTTTSPELNTETDKGSTIEHYQYGQGDNGVAVEHYKIIGGGHEWFDLSFQGQGINELIWHFVSQYDINGLR
jgi:polyhydroxybutyrate depolymerase